MSSNWNSPVPQESRSDRERTDFMREIWSRVKFGSFDWTPPLVAGNTTSTFTVRESGGSVTSMAPTGLRVGMPVYVTAPAVMSNGLSVQALVATNDVLTIAVANVTAGGLTPPAGTWSFQGVIS